MALRRFGVNGAADLTARRCVLRPIARQDAEQLHELWTSPGVRRFLWDGDLIPLARTRAAIETSERMFRERAFGLWGVWAPRSRSLLGFAGLWPFRKPPELELLYGVAERSWGRGYGSEIARAVLAYCFDVLDMPVVRASTDAANAASVRVLEKLGFTCVRRDTAGGLDTGFYEVQQREFRRAAAAARPRGGRRREHVDFEVRSADAADAAALSELAVRAKSHWGYPPEWIRHWRRDLTLTPQYLAANAAFVALCGGRIIGVAALHVQNDRASLEHVWIAPEYHRRGVGRALVGRALEAAKIAGVCAVRVESEPHAEPFYLKLGARRAGAVPAPMPGAPDRTLPLLEFDLPGRRP